MSSGKKKINSLPLVIVFLISFFVGLFGLLYVADYSREMSDDNIRLSCDAKRSEISRSLCIISDALNLTASSIKIGVTDVSKLKDNKFQSSINRMVENQLYAGLAKVDNICNVYFRYDPEIADSDIAGFFYKVENGNFKYLEPTPILSYSPDDIPHVGWFYLPKKSYCGIWLDPYVNSNVDISMISYVVPIWIKNRFVGVVGADMSLENLLSYIDGLAAPNGGNYFLTDNAGNVLNNYKLIEKGKKVRITKQLENKMYFGIEIPGRLRNTIHGSHIYRFVMAVYLLMLALCFAYLIYVFLRYSRSRFSENVFTHKVLCNVFGITAIVIFVLQLTVFLVLYVSNKVQPSVREKPLNHFEKTFTVAADRDFSPYSILDERGVPNGYEVEVLNILANRIGFNLVYEFSDWNSAAKAVREQKADILLCSEIDYKGDDVRLVRSVPFVDDVFTVVGRYAVNSLNDFTDKKIAYLSGDNSPFIIGVESKISYFNTHKELLEAVESGRCDYGLLRENVFEAAVKKDGYIDLHKVYNLMNSSMGLAVNYSHEGLCKSLNAELKVLANDGTLEKLYLKWVGFSEKSSTPLAILSKKSAFFIITCIVIVLCVISILFLALKRKSDEGELVSNNLWMQLEALSRNYVSMYLIDMDKNSFKEYKSRKYIRSAIQNSDSVGNAREIMPQVIEQIVCEEDLAEMLEFTNLNTISDRLKGASSIEIEFRGKYAGWCRGKFMALDINRGSASRYIIWAVETIDEEKRREQELRLKSEIDQLTGINNRGSGEARIRSLMAGGKYGMFVLFDVDKFKSVNDNYGHSVGDKVLVEIASCMRFSFRDNDVIMRFGGDEFAAYAVGAVSKSSAQMILDRFFEQIDKIYIPDLIGRKISVSVGVSFYTEESDMTFDDVYRQADECTYSSKAVNGNFYTFYKA